MQNKNNSKKAPASAGAGRGARPATEEAPISPQFFEDLAEQVLSLQEKRTWFARSFEKFFEALAQLIGPGPEAPLQASIEVLGWGKLELRWSAGELGLYRSSGKDWFETGRCLSRTVYLTGGDYVTYIYSPPKELREAISYLPLLLEKFSSTITEENKKYKKVGARLEAWLQAIA